MLQQQQVNKPQVDVTRCIKDQQELDFRRPIPLIGEGSRPDFLASYLYRRLLFDWESCPMLFACPNTCNRLCWVDTYKWDVTLHAITSHWVRSVHFQPMYCNSKFQPNDRSTQAWSTLMNIVWFASQLLGVEVWKQCDFQYISSLW